MVNFILFGVLLLILIFLTVLTYDLKAMAKKNKTSGNLDEDEERTSLLQNLVYTSMILVIIGIVAMIWIMVRNTPWESHLMEWLNIVIRLMHFTFGIAWIGASFYFVFLENALNRTEGLRDELAGNLWAVHGGGFYYLEKYKVAPKQIPKHLHWFKYESYFTWLTGFSLLFVVYYFNANSLLIDKNILDITPYTATALGVGSFIVAWVIYDQLCKSPLINNMALFALAGFTIAIGFAYFYTHVFSARGAFIHFGAMIGSIMVANVFFVIIPSQKAMVRSAKLGIPPDPSKGKKALARSIHNNYFTFPVLFIMVSNHFPSTFGYTYPWIILAGMSLGTAGIKHYLNIKEKGEYIVWLLPVSVMILLGVCFITAPAKQNSNDCKQVSFSEVNQIISKRCAPCHSAKPTDDVYKLPPNGIMYDKPEDIVKLKERILQRAVITKTMPQGNKTGITQEERNTLGCWIEQGANIK
jgi:uncharacterized membrane protein